ncbi:hypothetical protein C8Q75DRAFT_484427 [Abortiporus biennis]|nr:hypothetical protein C8Q75DRAFT_484427 [Abortiporus biennis]
MHSTLTINWKSTVTPNDILERIKLDQQPTSDHTGYYSFEPTEEIYSNGEDCNVFKGFLRFGTQEIVVVAKFCYNDVGYNGEVEAKKYCLPRVQAIQGVMVPRFYGAFKGNSIFSKNTSCLLLEYVGKRVPWLTELNCELENQVITATTELHKKGISHRDLLSHIFQHPDGRIVFIGLSKLSVRHKCKGVHYPIKKGYAVSLEDDKVCRELRHLMLGLKIWVAADFWCFGHNVSMDYAYPKPLVVELVQREASLGPAPSLIDRIWGVREATEAIDEYLKRYHPEAYKKHKLYL